MLSIAPRLLWFSLCKGSLFPELSHTSLPFSCLHFFGCLKCPSYLPSIYLISIFISKTVLSTVFDSQVNEQAVLIHTAPCPSPRASPLVNTLPWCGLVVALIPDSDRPGSLQHTACIRGFSHGSGGKEAACNAGDLGSIPGSGRCSGEGNGNPLQCSCLHSPWGRRVGHDWATNTLDFGSSHQGSLLALCGLATFDECTISCTHHSVWYRLVLVPWKSRVSSTF